MKEFYVPSVRELLDNGAQNYKNSPFIKYTNNGEVYEKSFVDIQRDSKAVCRFIRNKSDKKMNVAVIGKTSYEYLVFMSGVLISGNTGVPFSPDISEKEAELLLNRADIEMLLCEDGFFTKAECLKEKCPTLKYIENYEASADMIYNKYSDSSEFAPLSDYEVDKKDCALIIFTSGTTGVKKGVMLSTNALVGNIMYHDYCTDIFTENDVSLSVLPMYHCYCFSGDFLKNLKDGLQVCLNGNLKDITTNLKIFEPKVMRVVPMIAQSLLMQIKRVQRKNPDFTPRQAAEQVYGKNIQWLISGGAYLNPELAIEYEKYGIKLRQGYGMTEAGCRISVPDNDVSVESVGRVTDVCTARIVDGEIQVSTPTLMTGYYKMPEETAEMFTEDGWLKTGDIGELTPDGELFVTGRVKNLIILSSGENVSPEAIEKKFGSEPLVNEVLICGEDNRIVAEIYPDYDYAESNGIDDIEAALEEIIEKMNSSAKASHIISKIKVHTEPLERTDSGKIKRHDTVI